MGVNKTMNSIISNLKQSYKSWGWAPVLPLSMAGVMGVAGLVLGFTRDPMFGVSSGFSWFLRKDEPIGDVYLVPGLQNLGNNCFLNVVLQALASCSSFHPSLRRALRECESSAAGESEETLQLTVSLSSLLDELCTFCNGRVVLSPRGVMLAMANYIPKFNLTSQQDAEEAFLHLLSSLREEVLDCYSPSQSSLADALASPGCRILNNNNGEILNELDRWQQYLLGPFDGILCSILTCETCSSQISMNFQFFHCLPISPVLNGSGTGMVDSTLEDCLKQFITAEKVENYNCNHCWHFAAIKYLTVRGSSEIEIEKLKICSEEDSCACRLLSGLENLPWSSNFSCPWKQLIITRCPKILCIHIQRVFVNPFGESIKFQGHIRFPLVLNMLPFMLDELPREKPANPFPAAHSNKKYYQYDQRDVGLIGSAKNVSGSINNPGTYSHGFSFPYKILPDSIRTDACLEDEMEGNVPVSSRLEVNRAERGMYQLVAAVEHYGRAGGGHYTVYRSSAFMSQEQLRDECASNPSHRHWFCISDSDVQSVTEEDVLSAEASLLFYERIGET